MAQRPSLAVGPSEPVAPRGGPRPNLDREAGLWAQGYAHVAGLDEAGRGAWAGPVVAAAVVLPSDDPGLADALQPVRDSKTLTARQRDRCYDLVRNRAVAFGVGFVSAPGIDRLGILPATRLAMRRALEAMDAPAEHLLIDAVHLPAVDIPQDAFFKGDRDCLSVAAASILAKVSRDRWMIALEERLPGYGMARHKGYGTRQHKAALMALGPTHQHRYSYAPVRAAARGRYA